MLTSPKFVGLQNYATLFQDTRYIQSLKVTFSYVIISVPLQLIVALALAVVLDRGMRGLTFYRSAFYLPSMLGGSVAIAVLWKMVFGSEGLFNQALGLFGLEVTQSWIANTATANGTLMVLHIWQFGSPMVIFLAGLRQIPRELYEAASVDGAGKWRQFVSITLPMLSPIIFFNLVISIINSFQTFTQAFVVSGGTGGPNDATLFYTLYLYMQGFGSMKMGYAAAMAWILVVIVAALTVINFVLSKYWCTMMTNATTTVNAVSAASIPVRKEEHKIRRIILQVVKQLVVLAFALIMLYPILWMVASSLRKPSEIFTNMGLWVSDPQWHNYVDGWNALSYSFGRYFLNSFIIVAFAIVGNVLTCSMAAYAFARLNFKFRGLMFGFMLLMLMIPCMW
ncbi:ABC transporter permease subunit [Bifidobacterium eulemuris]|uniref:ABC transporter permease subunit n=1 Tax=Bifidobacterium eulemuris TaxID=1765219 RepID=UPI001D020CDA|nr:ABC transporter permease subunit [Bifidobacterium eulemuris]